MNIQRSQVFLTIILLITQLLSITDTLAQRKVLVKSIEYDVPIFNELSYNFTNGTPYADWWDQNIEESKRYPFVKILMDKAENGEIEVYNDEGAVISVSEVNQILTLPDTVKYQRSFPPYNFYDTILLRKICPGVIQYLRFREDWYFDARTFEITKQISEYAPIWVEYHNKKKTGRTKYLFWIKCGNKANRDFKILTDLIGYDLPLKLETDHPSFADIYKLTDESNNSRQYINLYTDAIEMGEKDAYKCTDIVNFYNYNLDSIKPLGKQEAYSLFNITDSLMMQMSSPPYYWYDTVVHKTLDRNDILGLKFLETWHMNPLTFEIKKEIIGTSTLVGKYDSYEGFMRIEELFYYPYDVPVKTPKLK